MLWIVLGAIVVVSLAAIVVKLKMAKEARELESNSIPAEELYSLLENGAVKLYDIRQPLDLLAHSEKISNSLRVSPKEVAARPELIPKDEDVVIYCTCEGQKTSLEIVRRAQGLGYSRVKLLRGGLAAWKAKGYPVEIFRESFRLDTAR